MHYYFCQTDNPVEHENLKYIEKFVHHLIEKAYGDATAVESREQADLVIVNGLTDISSKNSKQVQLAVCKEADSEPHNAGYYDAIHEHCYASLSMNRKLVASDRQHHLYIPYWLTRYHSFKHYQVKKFTQTALLL